MPAEKKVEHTQLPWRASEHGSIRATWEDGTEVQIAVLFTTSWTGGTEESTRLNRRMRAESDANAAYIVKSANYHDRLREKLSAAVRLLDDGWIPPEQDAIVPTPEGEMRFADLSPEAAWNLACQQFRASLTKAEAESLLAEMDKEGK